jgi:hypothetical protein
MLIEGDEHVFDPLCKSWMFRSESDRPLIPELTRMCSKPSINISSLRDDSRLCEVSEGRA